MSGASAASLSLSDLPWDGSVDVGVGLLEVLILVNLAARRGFLVAYVVCLELGIENRGWW